MHQLISSSAALFILGQIGLILVITCLMLACHVRRANKRKAELRQRLENMSQLYRSTLILLTRRLGAQKSLPQAVAPPNDPLSDKLSETRDHLNSLGTETTSLDTEANPEIQAAQIRYQMLLAEQELSAAHPDPNHFWQHYTARTQALILELLNTRKQSESPEVTSNTAIETPKATDNTHPTTTRMDHAPANTRAEIDALNRTIDSLKAKLKYKESYREAVLESWEIKKNQITQHYDRLLKATRYADNRNEVANILSVLFNDCADLGETINGERITHKSFDGLDQNENAATSQIGSVHTIDKPTQTNNGKVIVRQGTVARPKDAYKRKSPTQNINKALDKDIGKLKTVIQKQRSLILKLQERVSELETSNAPGSANEYDQHVKQLEFLLAENDNNIATLENELRQASDKINHLEDELFLALDALAQHQAGEADALKKLTEQQLQALEKERERLAAKRRQKKPATQ